MEMDGNGMDDDYEHCDPSLFYTVENILCEPTDGEESSEDFQALRDLYNSILMNACSCSTNDCSSASNCHHGGNYIVSVNPEGGKQLVLNSARKSKDLIYECFQYCTCSRDCKNRLVQYGPRKNLKIVDTIKKGKGLITTEPISKGAFICEYAGEIICKSEAERRTETILKNGNTINYIICLNELSDSIGTNGGQPLQTFIDPSLRGNIGRYLNHSCEPNCEVLSVRVDGPIPKLGIFAKHEISAFKELCFHYGGGISTGSKEGKPCYCCADNCQSFLPDLKFN